MVLLLPTTLFINIEKKNKMASKIYLLPGRKGKLDGFIGTLLLNMGYDVYGREVDGAFEQLRISKQIEIIQDDLKNGFWDSNSKIIASSYGAYLFLHTILDMEKFEGKVLLFSPLLGISRMRANKPTIRPPRGRKILEYSKNGKFPKVNIEVHTGLDDEICDPKLTEEIFDKRDNCKLFIVDKASHRLDKGYIECVLIKFLEK